ncbi:MAG: transglycosylase domain-containing protein [Erysipelotrichaceae bacterium]|nr:transglycosylase domain-containing protein [Erysipelotrichaceae bacterium]
MSDSQTNTKKKKSKKVLTPLQKKKRRRTIINSILIIFIICGLLGATTAFTVFYSIIKGSSIVLNVDDFKSPESTIIYDREGNIIATVGLENRINVKYEQLPQVVIDAFVSIEDSRFFEHSGFDIPRFTKSALENLKSMSFEQGGSTLTMQMVKNTYFVTEEMLAEKSIPRKVQEIYFSLKIEKLINKKQIFELYINKINFGGTARGIEAASHYYFNKSCSELTLSEAATLAGVINLPNLYNPYYNIDWATERRNETLNLMQMHGYITEEECAVAKKIKIEDLLVGEDRNLDTNASDPLQSYVDEVLNEIEDITGEDPYTTPMRVYTAMDPYVQEQADKIIRGEAFEFPDGYMQTGFAVVNNKTGEIVALGGGRGRNGERTFSYATDARKQPGSSIKPILDYALGFEYAGIASTHTELDDTITWSGTNIKVFNASNKFKGDVKIQNALTESLNIPALKVLRKAVAAAGNEKIVQYMENIGFDENVAQRFNEQYGIGGSDLLVSPLQMASAQAMLMNDGVYIEPHCITRVEFIEGNQEPLVPKYTGKQVLSPAASWLIASMMEKNVSNDYYLGSLKGIKKSYPVYAKTGTTDWGKSGLAYGIPRGAAKDNWLNASTSEFTISTWIGYDKAIKGKPSYITNAAYRKNIPGKIQNIMLDALSKSYGKPAGIAKPKGIENVTYVLGTWPYLSVPEWCPKEYQVTGMVKAGTAKIEPWPTPTIDNITSFDAKLLNNNRNAAQIQLTWSPLSEEMPTVVEEQKYKLPESKQKGTRLFSKTWIDGIVKYYVQVIDESGHTLGTYSFSNPKEILFLDLDGLSKGDHTLTLRGYYAYTIAPVQSGVIESQVTVKVSHDPEIPDIPENPENPENPTE